MSVKPRLSSRGYKPQLLATRAKEDTTGVNPWEIHIESMSLKIIAITIVSALVLSACSKVIPTNNSGSATNPVSQVAENSQAPDFTLQSFDNQSISLASLKGKAVFVDFWAAWCPFCIEEMPEIEKVSKEFGEDLVVLGIHRTETESVENAAKFAKDKGVTYQLLKDADGSIYKTYTGGRNFMPAAAFINKEGKIIKLLYGPKTEKQMRDAVKEALGQTS